MRKFFKIGLIILAIYVTFLTICYISPDVKAAVDGAVGPTIAGFGGSIIAGIEPIYTHYLAPWPNHAVFWGFIGLAFMYMLLWSWDAIRLKAKESIDRKAGIRGTKVQPIITHDLEQPKPTKPAEEKAEEKT